MIEGGESWEADGFSLDTLFKHSVLRPGEETEKREFTDMVKLKKRRNGEPEGKGQGDPFHVWNTMLQFFDHVARLDVRRALLDCWYGPYQWPAYMRHVDHRTLPRFVDQLLAPYEAVQQPSSELKETNWFIASHALTFTDIHQDAGGRQTWIEVLFGEKWWFYFRPNEAGARLRASDPVAFLDQLRLFDKDKTSALGTWFFTILPAGTGMALSSGIKHVVWTPEDSFMAGKHFDLPTFAVMERCLLEEHANGEAVTNAVRHGWFDALLAVGRLVGHPSLSKVITNENLEALGRMLQDPARYSPEDDKPGMEAELALQLAVEEVTMLEGEKPHAARAHSQARWIAGLLKISPPSNKAEAAKTKARGLPELHDARVRALPLARAAVAAEMARRDKGTKRAKRGAGAGSIEKGR
ncbi:hypothetical protein CALCODRAFT_536120 [Calocera cornea HHB12733]|uniref:JmjC domain-containing protein n=1 Tax=Calocera cornea HHB12733 TaxID=1353952 RepID=A0A165HQT8_9BASI|nr:hypothetical protein CALCODRAFT_536120 [Calocera cornea HHB12733]